MTGETVEQENKGGSPTKDLNPREELIFARREARSVLRHWKALGRPGPIVPAKDFVRLKGETGKGTNSTGKTALNIWFPIVGNKRANAKDWNLVLLESILRFDDPVLMLAELVQVDRAWLVSLEEYESAKTYGETVEDAIRTAYLNALGRWPYEGTEADLSTILPNGEPWNAEMPLMDETRRGGPRTDFHRFMVNLAQRPTKGQAKKPDTKS